MRKRAKALRYDPRRLLPTNAQDFWRWVEEVEAFLLEVARQPDRKWCATCGHHLHAAGGCTYVYCFSPCRCAASFRPFGFVSPR